MSRPPLNDLARQHARLGAALTDAWTEVLASGQFILGENVARFEEELARAAGAAHGAGVGSGTDAIRIGLLAAGVAPGDEVITVANAGVPPVAAIAAMGARPVLVDVDPRTRNLDPAQLPRALTTRTRAIVVVHLYGRAADMDPILELARAHELIVLEDCAHAHGARYRGRPVGALGHAGAFSFYPTKNLGALGDAGMLVSNDEELIARARMLRNHGWRSAPESEVVGTNSRLDELQAALLRVKLPRLAAWNQRRRHLAERYRARLGPAVELPDDDPEAVHHLFVVESERRDELAAHLAARAVGFGVHYPLPVHLHTGYRFLGLTRGALPVTERLCRRVLSLPLFPELEEGEQDLVIAAVADFAPP